MHAKLQKLANEMTECSNDATSTSSTSDISKFGTGLVYNTNHYNQNKLELESSLDEIIQPKRQLFIPRY